MALGGAVAATTLIASAPLRIAAEVLIGAAAGIASGLAGIGGGTVLVPAMVFLLGMDQHTAEGTSLLAILFTAAAATRVNVANRFVDWRAMWILGILGAATAPLAAVFALPDPGHQSDQDLWRFCDCRGDPDDSQSEAACFGSSLSAAEFMQ